MDACDDAAGNDAGVTSQTRCWIMDPSWFALSMVRLCGGTYFVIAVEEDSEEDNEEDGEEDGACACAGVGILVALCGTIDVGSRRASCVDVANTDRTGPHLL